MLTIAFTLCVFASVLSILTAMYLIKEKTSKNGYWLIFAMLSISIWSLMHGLQIVVEDFDTKLLFSKFTYLGMTVLPPFWLIFISTYTNRLSKLVETRYIWLIFIIPVTTIFLRFTTEMHGLVWNSVDSIRIEGVIMPVARYGPWFWIYIVYSYALVILGGAILILHAKNIAKVHQKRALLLLMSGILPVISSFVYILRIYPFDFTPVSFSLSAFVLFVSVYRYKITGVVPVARNKLIDEMDDAVMVFDDEGTLADMNLSARKIFGLDENCIGKRDVDIFGKNVLDLISRGGIYSSGEKFYDVRVRQISWGKKEGRIVTARDLTELKRLNENLEREVEKRTEEIKKLLKQKDEFIWQLGHDIKTPLTPILTVLSMVREKVDDKTKKMIDIALRNAEFMKKLATDTLNLTRLNSSDAIFNFEKIDLSEIVDECIKDNELLLENKKIEPVNHIRESIIVRADRLRLKEVISNLISNSVKYTPEGGKVEFLAERNDGEVIVKIKDNGIGLSPDQKERIFDEFYKVDRSRRDVGSSGLGLAICKRIIEKHGGRIWAESEGIGKGTSICFTLPVWKSERS